LNCQFEKIVKGDVQQTYLFPSIAFTLAIIALPIKKLPCKQAAVN